MCEIGGCYSKLEIIRECIHNAALSTGSACDYWADIAIVNINAYVNNDKSLKKFKPLIVQYAKECKMGDGSVCHAAVEKLLDKCNKEIKARKQFAKKNKAEERILHALNKG